MATGMSMGQTLRFQIDPQPGESARACSAIARTIIPAGRGNLLLFGLYGAVGVAAYVLTPATRLTTFLIGLGGVMGSVYGLQAVGRANLRRLQLTDPHSTETHFVEVSADGVHTWCSHVDARYPWADFAKVTENNEFYMLARPNGTGAAIPKRLLDDAADAQLRDCLRGWSPDRGANLAKDLAR
jgi:hypothetical protein